MDLDHAISINKIMPCIIDEYDFKLFPGTSNVAGQFIAAPPTCPGDTICFECTVAGDTNGVTFWRVDGGSSSCTLLHWDTSVTSTCNAFTAMIETVSASSFLSTLSGTATPELDGTLVECIGPNVPGTTVGSGTIQITGLCVSGKLPCNSIC